MLTVYNEQLTEGSFRFLKELIDTVDFDICICDGWAVYFIVNEYFFKSKNRKYIGSQDIDIGFNLKPMMSKSELESTNLFKMINILENKGYVPSFFGFKKDIYLGFNDGIQKNGEEILFTLYVDILVNAYPPSYQDIYHYRFFEVPLIEKVYDDVKYQVRMPHVSKYVFVPTREMMGAMKMVSLSAPGGNHHKMVKDLCDLYALIWFTDSSSHNIIDDIVKLVASKTIDRLHEVLTKNLMDEAEYYLGEPAGSLQTVLRQFFTK